LFRTEHLFNFPFYYLPETKASAELRQEKPFFWLAIMSVTSTNLTQQLSLARLVRELASKEIVMEGERTLDLLLGVMCICAWYVHHLSTWWVRSNLAAGVTIKSSWGLCLQSFVISYLHLQATWNCKGCHRRIRAGTHGVRRQMCTTNFRSPVREPRSIAGLSWRFIYSRQGTFLLFFLFTFFLFFGIVK
jgi:hypothetical protein